MKTARIQRKRTKGWRMPENTIAVSRGTKWGNPFKVGAVLEISDDNFPTGIEIPLSGFIEIETPKDAFYLYEKYLSDRIYEKQLNPKELKGKNLACWCSLNKPCHADILLKIANQ